MNEATLGESVPTGGGEASSGFNEIREEYGDKLFADFRAEVESEANSDKFDLTPLSVDGEPNNTTTNDERIAANGPDFDLTPLEPIENGFFVSNGEQPMLPDNEFKNKLDLTPLELDRDEFAEMARNEHLEEQAKSPMNGGSVEATDTHNIMRSEYDDHFYHTSDDEKNKQLKSVSGAPLRPTDTPDIMTNDYDEVLHHVSGDGQITPLKSPINGGKLGMTEIPGIMKNDHDNILYHVSDNGEITPLQSPITGNSLVMRDGGFFVDEATGQQFSLDDIKNR